MHLLDEERIPARTGDQAVALLLSQPRQRESRRPRLVPPTISMCGRMVALYSITTRRGANLSNPRPDVQIEAIYIDADKIHVRRKVILLQDIV